MSLNDILDVDSKVIKNWRDLNLTLHNVKSESKLCKFEYLNSFDSSVDILCWNNISSSNHKILFVLEPEILSTIAKIFEYDSFLNKFSDTLSCSISNLQPSLYANFVPKITPPQILFKNKLFVLELATKAVYSTRKNFFCNNLTQL